MSRKREWHGHRRLRWEGTHVQIGASNSLSLSSIEDSGCQLPRFVSLLFGALPQSAGLTVKNEKIVLCRTSSRFYAKNWIDGK